MKKVIWLLALPILLLFNGCKKENLTLKDPDSSRSEMNIEAITTNNTSEDLFFSEDEVNNLTADDKELGIYTVPIKYSYNALVGRSGNRYVISCYIYPITANPMVTSYEDQYGRTVTRSLTLFDHLNTSFITSYTSVTITWSCTVFARYIYSDGTPEKSRIWTISKTKTSN